MNTEATVTELLNAVNRINVNAIGLVITLLYTGATDSSDRVINLMDSSSQVNNGGAGLLTFSGGITSSVTNFITPKGTVLTVR